MKEKVRVLIYFHPNNLELGGVDKAGTLLIKLFKPNSIKFIINYSDRLAVVCGQVRAGGLTAII